MKLTNDIVDKIADLAKLEFDKEAKEDILKDLNNILTFVEKLNEMDTEDVEPLIYISEEVNVLRKDEVNHQISKDDALKNVLYSDEKVTRSDIELSIRSDHGTVFEATSYFKEFLRNIQGALIIVSTFLGIMVYLFISGQFSKYIQKQNKE